MNGAAAQSKFAYQRPANAIYRVGPAGSGMYFTTITAALAAAVADGHTDATNPATIEIYPGTYNENPTLGAGITLLGMGLGVYITSGVFCNFVGGTVANNISNIVDITLQGSAGQAIVLDVNSTVGGVLNVRNSKGGMIIESSSTGAGTSTGIVRNINSANMTVRFFDTTIRSNNVLDVCYIDAEGGATEFYGRSVLQNSTGGTSPLGIKVNGSAQVANFATQLCNSAFTIFTQIQATTALFVTNRTTLQLTNVGGVMFNFTAAGTVRARNSLLALQDATSSIATGTGSMSIAGCQYANTISAPFSAVADTVTINQTGTYGGQRTNNSNEFYVGRGVGYSTIQAAITAAAAAATGARKVVLISPGNYAESLTLQPNVDLVADTQGISSNSFSPVTITGTHTLAFTAANQTINFKNIRFQSLLTNATPIISTTGAFNGGLRAYDCTFNKSFAGSATVFSFGTTAANANYSFHDCIITHSADGGQVFDLSTATNSPSLCISGQQATPSSTPVNSGISIVHQSGGSPVQILLINFPAAGGAFVNMFNMSVTANSSRLIALATTLDGFQFIGCSMNQVLNAGEFIYYGAAATNVNLANSYFTQSDAGGGGTKLIAEDSGSGGSLSYGGCAFQTNANVRNTLTATQMFASLAAI